MSTHCHYNHLPTPYRAIVHSSHISRPHTSYGHPLIGHHVTPFPLFYHSQVMSHSGMITYYVTLIG